MGDPHVLNFERIFHRERKNILTIKRVTKALYVMRDRGQNQDVISKFYGKVSTIPEFMKQCVAGSGS